jgi:hypothetical protein
MSTPFEIPEWLVEQSDPPPLPPFDDHRVEGLVNGFMRSTTLDRAHDDGQRT